MQATIINTQTLPMPIREKIRSSKVSITERDGGVMLLPIEEPKDRPTKLFGMFTNIGLSSDEFSQQKQAEKLL
jgi:hypothetical protein